MTNKLSFNNIEKLPIDFEDIMSILRNRIQTNLPTRWTDFLASNFGVELLEAIAYKGTLMNYYVNANVNECFLPTAKSAYSIYSLAKTIGYKPKPPSQALVTLKFYIETTQTRNISIPMYTVVTNEDGIPFYTTENKVIYAGETFVEVQAKSGSLVEDTYITTGVSRASYKLKNYPVNSIEYLYVNDIIYDQVDFIDMENMGNVYTLNWDSDFAGYFSFGDGKYGNNPNKGLPIHVLYVCGASATHNVYPYTITKISDTLVDSEGSIIQVFVTNEQSAVGAADAEELHLVKRNAPSLYRTQHRCVTRQDFRDITITIPGVKKVSVIDYEVMDNIGIFGVKICVIPNGGGYPNKLFKEYVEEILEEKKIAATQISVIDPTYIPFDVNCTIKIQPNISSSVITNTIRGLIYDYLYWENREFGEEVSRQEIYKLILSVAGVLSVVNLEMTENRSIQVTTTPAFTTNTTEISTLTISDTTGMITTGTEINIMDISGVYACTRNIQSINNDIITLNSPITANMNIGKGSFIYPILNTLGVHKYGEKEILLRNISTTINNELKYNILNLSYVTCYFEDDTTKLYKILNRIGDMIYLDKPIDRDIPDGTKIIVLRRKYIPTTDTVTLENSTSIKLTDYPRFSTGATLLRSEILSFIDKVVICSRSFEGVDYLSSYIDVNYLTKVNKVYIDPTNPFELGVDYTFEDNGKTIIWTDIGKEKISNGGIYYVDIVYTVIDQNPTYLKHYVKQIDNKYVDITPSIPVRLNEGSTFEYITDIYRIMPYEIATNGIISINTI